MSGHSKWAQIKRQKEKTDSQKSKIFGKFARLVTEEAKRSGGDLSSPSLKAAIDRAKAANMPSENIERAIKKASGDNSVALEKIIYESYGPGGVALIIEALTDNKNKAAQEVKHILSKSGFALAGIGSAAWAFEKSAGGWQPTVMVPLNDEDLKALDALVTDLETSDEVQEVFTNAE